MISDRRYFLIVHYAIFITLHMYYFTPVTNIFNEGLNDELKSDIATLKLRISQLTFHIQHVH